MIQTLGLESLESCVVNSSLMNGFIHRLAPDSLAVRRLPALRLFVALGVAVEGALEIAEGDDETGPAVDEAPLEDVM